MADVGELVPLGIVVRDVDPARTPMNANTVTLSITKPDQTVDNPVVVNPPGVAGYYVYDYIPTMAGMFVFRWRTTVPTLVLEGSFEVVAPGAPGVISMAKAKRLLKINAADDNYDDDIRDVIRAATGAAEHEAGRAIQRQTIVQTKRVRVSNPRLVLSTLPVISVTSVVNLDSGQTWLGGVDCDVDENGIVETLTGRPNFVGRLRCEYVAGDTVVSDPDQEAIGYILQHLWANRQGSSGRPARAGVGDGQSEMGYSIPNRARDLLGHAGPNVG